MHTRHADQPNQRQSYLLRIWRTGEQGPLRATLIDVAAPHACHHFVNLDELQNFLIVRNDPVGESEVDDTANRERDYCTPNGG